MKCFHVIGDYGPVGYQSVERMVIAQNKVNATQLFINYVKRHYGGVWNTMGKHNISINEMECKNDQ